MSDKSSDAGSTSDAEGEIEVIEVKASNSLVPNLTISVDKEEEGVEPSVEFHEEDENMEKTGDEEGGKAEESDVKFKVEAKAFTHTKIYENKILKEMGLTAEEARLRKQSRAKRFQSPLLRDEVEPDDPEKKLAEGLVAKVEEYNKNNDIFQEIRLDAVHLRGLDNMSTEDIFSFFDDLYPSHIEWINDTSCNVVWDDKTHAANAVLTMSRPNKPRAKSTDEKPRDTDSEKTQEEKKEQDDDELDLMDSDEEAMDVEEGEDKKPEPQNESNESQPFTNELRRCKKPFIKGGKKVLLKIRFANVNDKKTLGGAKNSQYYRKYGNPNYGNMRGILSRTFMKRFHGREARREYDGYKPEISDAERSHSDDRKHDSGKKTASKRMHSEKAWKAAKKARKNEDSDGDDSGDSSEGEEEKEDRELINSSAKDLDDAIPANRSDDEFSPTEEDTMMADRIAKKIEAARRSQDGAAKSGDLNVKIKGKSSVWARLGSRPDRDSETLARTLENKGPAKKERVLEQDRQSKGLSKSLRDRLGTNRR